MMVRPRVVAAALALLGASSALHSASCARGTSASNEERVDVASSALSTCVRQIEPAAAPSGAPPPAWLVLKTDGTVWRAPLGAAGEHVAAAVTRVDGLAEVESLADAEGEATSFCAVTRDRSLWCWGQNTCGAVGNGAETPVAAPVEIAAADGALRRSTQAVATGKDVTCAVTVGFDLWCWGQNDHGQLGQGMPGGCVSTPTRVSGPSGVLERNVKGVAVGRDHVCAVTRGGDAYCWGANGYGQTGAAAGADTLAPTLLAALTATGERALAVTAGAEASCAVLGASAASRTGEVACWGRNSANDGALGLDLGEADRAAPRPLAWLGNSIARVDMGFRTACALQTSGLASCWGANDSGQVGDGTTASRAPGVALAELAGGVSHVAVGRKASCAVKSTTALCWGASITPDGRLAQDLRPTAIDFCQLGVDGGLPGGACTTSADCVEETPVCSAGRCRRCRLDADCPSVRPVCLGRGTCVECTTQKRAYCTFAKPACDGNSFRCTDVCADDEDCGGDGSGKVCDRGALRCRDGCRAENGAIVACPDAGPEVVEDAAPTGPFRFQSDCAAAPVGRGLGSVRAASGRGTSGAPTLALAIAVALLARRRRVRLY